MREYNCCKFYIYTIYRYYVKICILYIVIYTIVVVVVVVVRVWKEAFVYKFTLSLFFTWMPGYHERMDGWMDVYYGDDMLMMLWSFWSWARMNIFTFWYFSFPSWHLYCRFILSTLDTQFMVVGKGGELSE